ncbi:MAG: glycosyltransferase family 39 protein [Stigonema ocellatum SAG 48.90 = DSM 106950]|nr:glycosyltransferase family 39 protein [Stigonema ocellatum SAG 48.90 = DSM 106950]
MVTSNLKPLQKVNDIYLLSSLMLIGLLLRLPGLGVGLWRDEASTYFDALPTNVAELMKTVIDSELNPPGFYLIMHQWMEWFGAGDVVFKVPALIFGLLLILATYVLGRVASTPRAGVIAASFVTFTPSAVEYSQEARPYSLTALLCCLVVLMYCQALVSKHQTWYLIGFVLCTVLLLYVQYTGLLLVGSLAITTLCLLWRGTANVRLMPFAIAFGIIFLLFTPWLPVFLTHLHTGTPWVTKEPWFLRSQLFFFDIADTIPVSKGGSVGGFFVLCALGLGAKQFFSRAGSMRLSPSTVTLAMCFVIPIFMEAALSYSVKRYMFPFVPIAWVLYGSWLIAVFQHIDRLWTSQWKKLSQRVAVVLLMVWLVLPNSITALSLGNSDKSGIRTLAAEWAQKHQENTIYVVNPDYLGPTAGYYFKQHAVELHGFARWDNPEIFSPQGYVQIWDRPTLVSDIEQQIRDKTMKGYRKLALIHQSGVLKDYGEMKYSQTQLFLSRLKQTYPLLETKDYPGSQEPVTLYVFTLTKKL